MGPWLPWGMGTTDLATDQEHSRRVGLKASQAQIQIQRDQFQERQDSGQSGFQGEYRFLGKQDTD